MKRLFKTGTVYTLSIFLLCSCSKRNLTYFSDLPPSSIASSDIPNRVEATIQSGDILEIKVKTLSPESNQLFNFEDSTSPQSRGYLVNKDGNINFPVVGQIKLRNLTLDQAVEKVAAEVKKFAKDPIVNINILNFKITVIGEVSKPSTFTVPDEKMTILEALGMAGDMTVFGKRENVLVIREKDGSRTIARINLNDKNIFNSPFFYLQQNDVIYVEPSKAKANSTDQSFRWLIPLTTATISAFAIIYSRYLFSNNSGN